MIWLWILLFWGHASLQENVTKSPNSILAEELPNILRQHPFKAKTYEDYRIADVPFPERGMRKDAFNISLPLLYSPVHLHLQPNIHSPHKHFAYLLRKDNVTNLANEDVLQTYDCFYTASHGDVKASIDLCEGLDGIILVRNDVYTIKPLPSKYQTSNAITSHVIVKLKPSRNEQKTQKSRRKRSFDTRKEVKIETAIFVDRDLYRHMLTNFPNNTERNLFRFVLAMINAVQLLYHDVSLEVKISFVLKRLEILHTDPPELQRSHDIDRYLSSFCSWQEKENFPREKSPLRWDHALMLTGLDLYVIAKSGKFSNQVLGLAPVAGMCKPGNSCTVNEGLHFESVYVVAHEIGHNLGMRHDGPSADNNCDANSHIMSPTLGSGKSSWSSCSNRYLQKFLQTPQAQCLFETTYVELDHTEGGTLPGERFDSNQQCMLKYGKQSERSPTQNMEEICRDLRCTKERYTWTSHPALEGTKCGPNKWCRLGRCVDRGRGDLSGQTIDGGWGQWGSFSECASGCLHGNHHSEIGSTGIAFASRTCNNPRPENGGKHCSGNDKKYQTCEAVQCSNVPPITVKEFAEQICRRTREVDKDLTGQGFQRNSSDPEEACTVWCYQYNGGAKTRGWTFPDGTSCHSKYSSNPMFCVSGRCEEFSCVSTDQSAFAARGEHCQERFIQLKPAEPEWTPVGPCRYNCITPAVGFRVLKRGFEHNIELCQANCNKKKTLFEYATNLCTRYRERVKKLSGLGIQLSASLGKFFFDSRPVVLGDISRSGGLKKGVGGMMTDPGLELFCVRRQVPKNRRRTQLILTPDRQGVLEDPDRPCHVACQDDKFSHRFYLVTGEDGWFPFGTDCARGIFGKKAYCVSGRCLVVLNEFGKNNMPTVESEFTFSHMRRKRSLDIENKTVIAMVDLSAVRRIIELLKNGNVSVSEPATISIDFDNPIHVKPDWEFKNETFTLGNSASLD